ncbi:hypothetical protein E3N88_40651 [Mikania micrantha]|uniref:Uncharacterized protein n=1 Tax=Mikania micrantha TaxID=192012 RepID=A0A5N6LNC8_9ASTR|nr:hypothetical protein E3N88_40651 [Mikania micrantha]
MAVICPTCSLTLQSSNSYRDVSFSSYLNKAEETTIRKLTNQASDESDPTKNHHYRKKSEEDDELGVFGAEKYFKEEIEDVEKKNDQRFIDGYDSRSDLHQQDENLEEFDHDFRVKLRTDQTNMQTPSVRSNVSCNSRVELLPRAKPTPGRIERGSKTRSFLANFGCNCINKKSTQINEKRLIQAKEIFKPQTKMLDFDHKTDTLSSKLAEMKPRNDYFSFPVLNSNDLNSNSILNSKSGNLAGKVQTDNNGDRLSLGRKLSLLNDWDVDIPTEEETYIPSSRMYNNDVASDSSSELFEIESFSTTGNNSFIAPRKSESNCYAPSEVSVDWSVVTASAADFSVFSDYDDLRVTGDGWRFSGKDDQVERMKDEQKKRPGILSGCTSHKAVRVAGDKYTVSVGAARGRRQSAESMAVGTIFRGRNI